MSNIDEIFYKEVTELIKTIPNDMELGEKVRRLYFGSENTNTNETEKRNGSCVCGRQTSGKDC